MRGASFHRAIPFVHFDGLGGGERPTSLNVSKSRPSVDLWRTAVFATRCTIVQSAILRSHVVCPSVTLVDHNHIGWKSWKLIERTISPTSSLFVALRSSTYYQGNMEKFGGENVRSIATSITSGRIESTESHVILGGGMSVCLLISAHDAVIFAMTQLSFLHCRWPPVGDQRQRRTGLAVRTPPRSDPSTSLRHRVESRKNPASRSAVIWDGLHQSHAAAVDHKLELLLLLLLLLICTRSHVC